MQKISVDAGFSCPNRDGRISRGGCVFCDNRTFNPAYCEREKSITQQIIAGKEFFSRKYPDMKYLAYFQAYSNTYADVEHLKRLYEEALAVDNVVGIVIGTRPDCVPDATLDYLENLNRQTFMIVEYGIESANNNTLKIINRGHTFECSADAVRRTAQGEYSPVRMSSSDSLANLPRTVSYRPTSSPHCPSTSSNCIRCRW